MWTCSKCGGLINAQWVCTGCGMQHTDKTAVYRQERPQQQSTQQYPAQQYTGQYNRPGNPAPAKPTSSSMTLIIVLSSVFGGIILLAVIWVLALGGGNTSREPVIYETPTAETQPTETPTSGTETEAELNTVVVNNLSMTYDSWWVLEMSQDGNSALLSKLLVNINIYYFQDEVFRRPEHAPDLLERELLGYYEEDVTILEKSSRYDGGIDINGVEWFRIEFTHSREKGEWYITVDEYEVYIITFEASDAIYDDYIGEFHDILSTASIDMTEKIESSRIAQEMLVGEWDCGDMGYFVFNEDGTFYFYMDSSKSMDNVIIGTYTAILGVPTHAAGYADGVSVEGIIEAVYIDGEDSGDPVSPEVAYAFADLGDGTWEFVNHVLVASGPAIKVSD